MWGFTATIYASSPPRPRWVPTKQCVYKISRIMARAWEERNLWVGNLPYSVTAAEIQALFEAIAPVVSVRLRLDPTTGESRGCGYVEFGDSETCRLVKNSMTGVELHGRPLRLDWATPVSKRTQPAETLRVPSRAPSPAATKAEQGTDPLSRLSTQHLLLLVADSQQLARSHPDVARRVLNGETEGFK